MGIDGVGLVFGVGFDTATEVVLLSATAYAALPFLFAGGMMLFDTLGGAFIIGSIEILSILADEIHLHGAFWDLMAGFDINLAGFCIAGLLVLVWAVALAYWRLGNVEDRWSASVAAGQPQPSANASQSRPGGCCRGAADRFSEHPDPHG